MSKERRSLLTGPTIAYLNQLTSTEERERAKVLSTGVAQDIKKEISDIQNSASEPDYKELLCNFAKKALKLEEILDPESHDAEGYALRCDYDIRMHKLSTLDPTGEILKQAQQQIQDEKEIKARAAGSSHSLSSESFRSEPVENGMRAMSDKSGGRMVFAPPTAAPTDSTRRGPPKEAESAHFVKDKYGNRVFYTIPDSLLHHSDSHREVDPRSISGSSHSLSSESLRSEPVENGMRAMSDKSGGRMVFAAPTDSTRRGPPKEAESAHFVKDKYGNRVFYTIPDSLLHHSDSPDARKDNVLFSRAGKDSLPLHTEEPRGKMQIKAKSTMTR